MASTIKVTNINTPDGTGNITVDRPLSGSGASLTSLPAANLTGTLPAISGASLTSLSAGNLTGTVADARISALTASKLTGALPAISGASLTNLPAGGDRRNFIIDGAFTQWPVGNITGVVHSAYTSALMKAKKGAMDNLVWDAKKTTDSPTAAESGYDSIYCYHADITTAESASAVDEYSSFVYYISGLDFAALDRQEMTLNFWHKHTVTGTCVVAFGNAAGNRYYLGTYTQSVSNTWEEASITFTGETTGTWVTDAHATDFGMSIAFVLASGSTYHQTANTWWTWPGSGASFAQGVSGMADHTTSASNDFKIAQVGLYLGSTAPTRFLGESIATVKNQVDYYVQRWGSPETTAANDPTPTGGGHNSATTTADYTIVFRRPMRVEPTMRESAAAGFRIYHTAAVPVTTGMVEQATTLHGTRYVATVSSGLTQGHASQLLFDASDDFIMADARH